MKKQTNDLTSKQAVIFLIIAVIIGMLADNFLK